MPGCPGYNGPTGYVGGNAVIVAPTPGALRQAVREGQNAIGGGSYYYFPGGDLGYPVTSNAPVVRQAVAQAICAKHPTWCTVIGGKSDNSLLGQLKNVLNAMLPLIGAMADDGGETLPTEIPESVSGAADVAPGKCDYIFGRVESSEHNLGRSTQLASQFARIGVYDTESGRALLQEHFSEVLSQNNNIVDAYTDKYGTYEVRDSLFAGPGGFLKLQTTWQVTPNGYNLSTVIPFGGP